MGQTIKHWQERLLASRRKNVLRGREMNFYASLDLSLGDNFDTKAFEREWKVDELVVDLMNYIRDVDYCDEVLRRNGYRDH